MELREREKKGLGMKEVSQTEEGQSRNKYLGNDEAYDHDDTASHTLYVRIRPQYARLALSQS